MSLDCITLKPHGGRRITWACLPMPSPSLRKLQSMFGLMGFFLNDWLVIRDGLGFHIRFCFCPIVMFLSMLLMDSDPHSYGSICGKSIVVTSYSMKPLRSSKVVKVMFIIDYTHVHMLGNFWIITNLGWFGFTIRLLSLKRVMLLVVCRF
jgi:hypothetical protein